MSNEDVFECSDCGAEKTVRGRGAILGPCNECGSSMWKKIRGGGGP